jgi:hypothetical protein
MAQIDQQLSFATIAIVSIACENLYCACAAPMLNVPRYEGEPDEPRACRVSPRCRPADVMHQGGMGTDQGPVLVVLWNHFGWHVDWQSAHNSTNGTDDVWNLSVSVSATAWRAG